MIRAIKAYEEALIWPDRPEKMQAATTTMDDLKAWDFEASIKEILFKFNIRDLQKKVDTLSGGQKKRLALAKLIIDAPEFMILDEPTNHLDLDMIEWLEEYLQQGKVTLLMVTHDRYFLERVCNYIVELDAGIIYRYKGGYSDFLIKKTTREEIQTTTLDRTKKLMKRELEWVRRMPQGRGTKAKARVDKFHEIKEKATQKIDKSKIQIDIKGQRLGKTILEAQYISKSFGDLKIVEDFDYKFRSGERVGIVGPNGVGKKLTAFQLLERFLFNRKQQQVYISQLSGGERRRLYLLSVLMENPNFLILDEPTNDLDILTLNILEDFLMDFPGCIIIVTHDRYFMDKVVEHLFVFEGQKQTTVAKAKEKKQKPQFQQELTPGLSYEQRKEFKRLEKQIEKLEEKKSKLTEKFNDTSLNPEEIEKYSKELGAMQEELEEKEMRWMELAELS